MNAIAAHNSHTVTSLGRFVWLLKREYWEHRGGALRAPMVMVAVLIAVLILSLITGDLFAHQHGININGLNLDQIAQHISEGEQENLSGAIRMALGGLCIPIAIWLAIATFFYLVGALYDDRRDRSVLFWKSLPLSDWETVLSKVVFAAVVFPIVAVVAAIALQLAFLIVLTVYAMLHGVNAIALLWVPDRLIALWLKFFLLIPVNALWALPTIGWLLLCSAFARSKPFLWALTVPAIVGVIISWTNFVQNFSLPSGWYWREVFSRIMLGTVPMGWLTGFSLLRGNNGKMNVDIAVDDPNASLGEVLKEMVSFNQILDTLTSPSLWIGVAAGAAMIVLAIHFRQKRTEAYA